VEAPAIIVQRPPIAPQPVIIPEPVLTPAAPRQRLLDLLAAFLEEKNIRWGEIVGGLLIVGCSLALVMSFWSSIAERPLLKFGLFTGVTALLFALGLHAERRWRLPTTALGLLVISTLLIPLNFLAVASIGRGAAAEAVWGVAGELVAVGLFTGLTYLAGRCLVSQAPAALTVGVLVPSATLLLIRRFVEPGGDRLVLLALGSVPLLAQGGAVAALLRRVRRSAEIDEPEALNLLRLLGLTTFAVGVALGLLIALGGPIATTLHRAALLAPLAGAPALAVGMLLWRRTNAPKLVGYRTAGTAIAAAGALVMLAGVALGWPDPAGMIPVAALDFVVLTALAVGFEVPAAHVLAGACLTLTYLLAWHVGTGALGWTSPTPAEATNALFSSRSGSALTPLVLLFGAASALVLRLGRRLDAQALAMVAALAWTFSLGLATWYGFGRPGDPAGVAWVYAVDAVASLGAAGWFGRNPLVERSEGRIEAQVLGWVGSGLLLAALIQDSVFGWWRPELPLPWVVALLLHATVTAVTAALLAARSGDRPPTWAILLDILSRSALATSAAALGGLAIAGSRSSSSVVALDLLWLGLVWLILAWRYASPPLFALFQAALAGSVVFAVAFPWHDPRSIQAQAVALCAYCLAWIGIRRGVRSLDSKAWATARTLLDPPWPTVDRCLRGVVLLALAALALVGVLPGVARELMTAGPVSDVAHTHALGIGSWVLLGGVLVLLLAGQWERFRPHDLLAAVPTAWMAVPLLAGRWEGDLAVTQALGWWSVLFFLVASLPIWGRCWLGPWVVRLGWGVEPGEIAGLRRPVSGAVLVLGLLPIAALTIPVVFRALAGEPFPGPVPSSLFSRLGPVAARVPPIVLATSILVGYAVRERSAAYAFAAVLSLNFAVTAGYLLSGVSVPLTGEGALWTHLALRNAIVASASALTWIGTLSVWRHVHAPKGPAAPDRLLLLDGLIGLVLALDLLVLLAGTVALFFSVDPLPGAMHAAIAGPWGWAALGLTAGAVVARASQSSRAIRPDFLCLAVLSIADFLALALAINDTGDWRTYHGILAGQALAGAALMLVAWQRSGLELAALGVEMRAAVGRWASLAMGVVVLFALRAYVGDPQAPWWTVGGLACMAPLAAALAVWASRPVFLALAGILLNLAVTLWYCWHPTGDQWADLVNVNVLTLALPAPLWLGIDLRLIQSDPLRGRRPWLDLVERVPFQRVAAWVAVGLLALVVALGVTSDAMYGTVRPNILLGWAALAATAMALAAGLWDVRSRASVAGLYLLGLCASGWVLHQLQLPPRWLILTGTVVLSAYSVATSYLWSRRTGLRGLASRLGIPAPDADDPLAGIVWLAPANLVLAALVLILAFGTILSEPEALLRSLAAHAALAEVLATGLLAQGERRLRLQFAALCVGVVGAVAWGWAWIAPDAPAGGLDRLVTLLVVLVGASALYGLGLVKLLRRETEWTRAAVRLVPGLVAVGGVVLALVLGTEVFEQANDGRVAMSAPAVVSVALALLAAAAAALVAAVVPGRDPLGLSDRGRTAYVYGCEAILAVLVLHLRLTMPWLFSGFFARYRPLIVLGVAYLGVGLSELFRRQGRLVLAEPLERTGALLPALPLLGAYWIEIRPGIDIFFLVLAGGLYTTLSMLRSSLGFGALATLAYNGALWVLLGRREGLSLFDHPQLWIIPPAFCVLIGAYLNRDRLTEAQTTSIRYAASLAIYLSSTADILLIGVAQAPWLPLVLAALSLAGIFAGIALRVRGFFLLGLGFLGLSLMTIIWHAAVDLHQTWLWSASGIVVGFLIIGLFGLFEKKRQDVVRVVDEFKQWNA
jgi:hypothetical protein